MNGLVRLIGFRATLVHGDTLVLDRWRWLATHLPVVDHGSQALLDIGCGSGAFTIGAALRGYRSLGLSWDARNQSVARQRALLCGADLAAFEFQDVRKLDERSDLEGQFDILLCCETIEHILDDGKLMMDMANCLRPGGQLLLTTPNFEMRTISPRDAGPFSNVEDGGHVRKGYLPVDLKRLCSNSGLAVDEVGYCSGFTSQKITRLMREGARLHALLGWALVAPLRVVPRLADAAIQRWTHYPAYSVTVWAHKL